MKDKRFRNFCFLVYPESAPENWKDILDDMHIPMLISPLHDKDTKPDGEPKKPHHHIMLMFDGKKSYEQFCDIADQVGGVYPHAEDLKAPEQIYSFFYLKQWVINDVGSYARYLCHLDNDDKVKYNPEDVVSLGGVDYFDIISIVSDKYACISQMIDFIKDNGITDYIDVLTYAKDNNYMWFRVLCDCGSYVILNACKSNKFKFDSKMKKLVQSQP